MTQAEKRDVEISERLDAQSGTPGAQGRPFIPEVPAIEDETRKQVADIASEVL
ncbi:hypothetical protein HOF56_02755 [Candidatus Peribacteria bacterium]|nr:hypothetical protein [Candidatus Peribacteria bacterium]